MSSSAWDDLFALAEGKGTKHEGDDSRRGGSPFESTARSKRGPSDLSMRAKKRGRHSSPHESFLSSRRINTTDYPSFVRFGSSMTDQNCPAAKFSTQKTIHKPCKRCGGSNFRHVITSSESHPALSLFCCIRNLRHLFFLWVKEDFSPAKALGFTTRDLQKVSRELTIPTHQTQLRSRLEQLEKSLKKSIEIFQKGGILSLEQKVRLIIDCDAIYFDLYYMEITTTNKHRSIYVPHPTLYFGESMQELDQATDYLSKIAADATHSSLRSRHGLDCDTKGEDPLTAIRYYRFLETIQLFQLSGWLAENKHGSFIESAHVLAGNDFYKKNETPAPPLLSAWRDSCRDFLTHLYSYATVDSSTLRAIKEFAGDDQRIIEVGSGTGYMASLLRKFGASVDAHDSHPGIQNEYHGSTPTFTQVTSGDAAKVLKRCQPSCVLLLCYPPPDSNMAVDALQAFLKRGGTKFVHVGEFKGLTGTPSFERLLLSEFSCSRRYECVTWVTDAATVTFWEKMDKSSKVKSALLPCSVCGGESRKRLRFVRYLQYCSATCWQRHQSKDLSSHLLLSTVELGSPLPEFVDDKAFLKLDE